MMIDNIVHLYCYFYDGIEYNILSMTIFDTFI